MADFSALPILHNLLPLQRGDSLMRSALRLSNSLVKVIVLWLISVYRGAYFPEMCSCFAINLLLTTAMPFEA